jgi:hypothetical protein
MHAEHRFVLDEHRRILKMVLQFGGHRDSFRRRVKDPASLRIAEDALDAYERLPNRSIVTHEDIAPIAAAAKCPTSSIRDCAIQMLILLALDWRCARDVLLDLVSHSRGDVRWTAITNVPYWVNHQPFAYPRDFVLAFLRTAVKDRGLKNRHFSYMGTKSFYRPELLPELRRARAVETDAEVLETLDDVIPYLERGFFYVPQNIHWTKDLPASNWPIWIYMADGSFAEGFLPLDLPIEEADERVREIRSRLDQAIAETSAP